MKDPLEEFAALTGMPILDPHSDPEDPDLLDLLTNRELVKTVGERLTWTQEPGDRMGDIIVFTWTRHQWVGEDKKPYRTIVPQLAAKLLANPIRHRKGHWHAPVCWLGLDQALFMDRGRGTTTNPLRAIDRDAEHETVEASDDGELSARRRMEQKQIESRKRMARYNAEKRRAA